MINTTNGLEKQKVDYKVKCPECGKDARMTYLMRDDEGEKCVFVECEHCNNESKVPIKLVEIFESIGAAICDAKMRVGCLLNI